MKIVQRILVLLIAMTMLMSGSFAQVFANEEIEDNSAAVAVSEETSDSEAEAEAEKEAEKAEEVVEEPEETQAEEPEKAEEDKPEAQEEEPAAEDKENPAEETEAEDEAEAETFTAGTLTYECDEYTVTLEYGEKSEIPEGTKLAVREISSESDDAKEQKEYEEYYDRSLEQLRSENGGDAIAKLGFARFYDITLISEGKEIEPGDNVKVTFTYSKDSRESVKDDNSKDDAIRVIHMTDSAKNGEIKAEPIEKKDTDLTLENKELKKAEFTAESFSVYGIVYTVDFEYEGYTYSIAGESEIMLSRLFSILNIAEIAKDAENVEFTDYSLIRVEKIDDDWKLTSLKPFDTEEKLTVTLADKIIEIKVTDEPFVARVKTEGGDWTYHSALIDDDTQGDGTKIGAFDQANTLSGDVTVELLMDSSEYYTLTNGFTFKKSGIRSLSIRGTDNKSTLVKDQKNAPMITTEKIGTVEFSNIVFSGSGDDTITKDKNGGAVNTDAETLNVSSCDFIKCYAGLQGGGIYHYNTGGTVTIADSTFTGCRSCGPNDDKGGGGGGFLTDAKSLTVTDCQFNGCTTEERQGAGFFHKRLPGKPESFCSVKDCYFTDCVSAHSGGGMESDAIHTTLTGCHFENCMATNTKSDPKEPKGGAFNVYAGGATNSPAESSLTVEECTFRNCFAIHQGGAVRSTAVKTTISGSSFEECSTRDMSGGAVSCTNNKTFTVIRDCEVSKCHAEKGSGGAFFATGTIQIGEVPADRTDYNTVDSTNIKSCSALKGGAIYGSKIIMTGGTVTGCTTTGESAAVDATSGTSGLTFSGNIKIENNKDKNEEARDVYLGTKTDRHILIDNYGLGDNASIGIYVANDAYDNHGKLGKLFAHTNNVQASGMKNLNKLFSDRADGDNLHMQGAKAVAGSSNSYQYRVMWEAAPEQVVAPTDVDLRMMPYILILVGGAALILMKKISDRRRKNEDTAGAIEE